MKTLTARTVSLLILLLCVGSCDLIDIHPYDAHIDGEKQINQRSVQRIERSCEGRDALTFAVISDTQRWYDETAAAVKHINARGDVDFVIHLGDLTDFGITKEFDWMRRELERFAVPYVCLLGNHDCLGTGASVFHQLYGKPDFSFTAGDTHFVCLNTNAFEYDYSVSIPDFAYLRADLESLPPGVRRTVVAMHAAPGTDQFNNNVSEIFQEKIALYPGLQFALCGHGHANAELYPTPGGIPYYECACAKKRTYLLFTLNRDGSYEREVIHY